MKYPIQAFRYSSSMAKGPPKFYFRGDRIDLFYDAERCKVIKTVSRRNKRTNAFLPGMNQGKGSVPVVRAENYGKGNHPIELEGHLVEPNVWDNLRMLPEALKSHRGYDKRRALGLISPGLQRKYDLSRSESL